MIFVVKTAFYIGIQKIYLGLSINSSTIS